MKKCVLFAVAVGLSAPAAAKLSPFTTCDLHAPPNGKSDGRDTPDRRSAAEVKLLPLTERISACTAALDDPALIPEFGARRIELLKAKAVLEVAAKDRDAAQADITRAELSGQPQVNDRFYARSTGLGLRMIAAAIALDGDTDHSTELTQWGAISAARPFDVAVQSSAFRELAAVGAPPSLVGPVADRLQRLDYGGAVAVIDGWLDLDQSRKAVELYDALSREGPEAAPFGPSNTPLIVRVAQRLSTIDRTLRIAYAKARLGDLPDSGALVTTARTQGDKWTADMPTSGPWAKELGKYGMTRDRFAAQVATSIAAWNTMIDARLAFDAHRAVDPKPLLATTLFHREQFVLFTELVGLAAEGSRGDLIARTELLRIRLAEYRRSHLAPALTYDRLPPAESGTNLTPFHASGHGLLHSSGTGWKADPQQDGVVAVTFTGYVPGHAVAEMALLGAAEATKQAGKAAFVVDETTDYAATNIYTQVQSNQNVMLKVRMLSDVANIRALRVEDVEAGLVPVFAGVTGPS